MTALSRLRRLAASLPDAAMISLTRSDLLSLLTELDTGSVDREDDDATDSRFWPDLVWRLDEQTLLDTNEAASALGRSRDWLYRHLATAGRPVPDPIPAVRLGGELRIAAGQLRDWITRNTEQAA